jgi:uncharacterized protein YndB with AHSA1/START domain
MDTLAPTAFRFSKSERELALSCALDASPAQVYAAWTGRLPEWWGPHGMTTPHCEMDLRPGGAFRTVMRAPDGTEYPTRGVFLEVAPGERIVFTDAFDAGWQPHENIFFTAIVTFTPLPADRTRLAARALHWTAASREKHEQMGFAQGWGESLERLAALLATNRL